MKAFRMTIGACAIGLMCAALAWAAPTATSADLKAGKLEASEPAKEGTSMTNVAATSHATGPFEVKLQPAGEVDKGDGSSLGRMTIDKQFHGDIEATSKGQMLTAMTETKGSAGYVAIERVTGTLGGKKGSFVLQHNATMTRGTPNLNIIVVPDSGTGELVGLTGTMKINVDGGKHSYEFEYTLPARP